MRLALGCVLAVSCALLLGACGSDEREAEPAGMAGTGGLATGVDGGSTASTDGGTPGTTPGDACDEGCVLTLAADCSNGPASQASCVSSCHALEAGSCGGQYATFQACAEGNPITCSAQGQPIVAACSDEQAAFVACLSN